MRIFLFLAFIVIAAVPISAEPEDRKGLLKTLFGAKKARITGDFTSIQAAVQMYHEMSGVYPTDKQGLAALVEAPTEKPIPKRWVKLMNEVPKDAWGTEYRYKAPVKKPKPKGFEILSAGPDKKFGTKDDLSSLVDKKNPKQNR